MCLEQSCPPIPPIKTDRRHRFPPAMRLHRRWSSKTSSCGVDEDSGGAIVVEEVGGAVEDEGVINDGGGGGLGFRPIPQRTDDCAGEGDQESEKGMSGRKGF